MNAIVNECQPLEYRGLKSGGILKYNLFVPRTYDKSKLDPLVLFLHDAGATSDVTNDVGSEARRYRLGEPRD